MKKQVKLFLVRSGIFSEVIKAHSHLEAVHIGFTVAKETGYAFLEAMHVTALQEPEDNSVGLCYQKNDEKMYYLVNSRVCSAR